MSAKVNGTSETARCNAQGVGHMQPLQGAFALEAGLDEVSRLPINDVC